jgi:Predicted Fe-S oxidoreductases
VSNQFTSKKIFQHCDYIAAWLRGENIFPVCVEIDMTNVCNNKCPQCTGGRGSPAAALSCQQAEILISELATLGVKAITFTGGGEPLCNTETMHAVWLAHHYSFDVGFITNGLALTKDKAERLADFCQWVRVSLDAGTPEMYLKTHGVDCFNSVVKNMAYLVGGRTTTGAGF